MAHKVRNGSEAVVASWGWSTTSGVRRNETNALLTAFSHGAGNAELKAWAGKTLPAIHAHQETVDRLDEADTDAPN